MLRTDSTRQAMQWHVFVPLALSFNPHRRQPCNISHTLTLLLQIHGRLTTIHVSLSKHCVYIMIYEEIKEKQEATRPQWKVFMPSRDLAFCWWPLNENQAHNLRVLYQTLDFGLVLRLQQSIKWRVYPSGMEQREVWKSYSDVSELRIVSTSR